MGPEEVFDYAKRLREAGIEEVRLEPAPYDPGCPFIVTHIRLAVAPPTGPAAPTRVLTEEEVTAALREKKRNRLSVELGFTPGDDLLDKLP